MFGDFCILVYWVLLYFLSVYVFFVCDYRLRYDSCFDFIFLPRTLSLFLLLISLNPWFLLLNSAASLIFLSHFSVFCTLLVHSCVSVPWMS